jgi:hypothetical protein
MRLFSKRKSLLKKKYHVFTTNINDSMLLTSSQDTLKALLMTNQELQEESFLERLEMLKGDRSESEIIQQD